MVIASIAPLLAKLGFKKRAGQVFTMDLNHDALGWLGLNAATKHRPSGEVEINPIIGVRHMGVERLVAELRGEEMHPYLPPTVSMPLGYLCPEVQYRSWIFVDDFVDHNAAGMVAMIAEYGLQFMRVNAELDELCRSLDKSIGFEHQIAYRRPVARFLLGDRQRARDELHDAVAKLAGRTDPAAEEFRRFGNAFRHRLEGESSEH